MVLYEDRDCACFIPCCGSAPTAMPAWTQYLFCGMKGKGMRERNKMREGDEKTEKNRASDEEERDLEEMEGWRNTDQNVRQRHRERILTVKRSMEMKRRNSKKREEKKEIGWGNGTETRRKCWVSPKGP